MIIQANNENLEPAQLMLQMIFGAVQGMALGVMAELGIADLLQHGSMSIVELASKTGTDITAMKRFIGLLKYHGLISGNKAGKYSCTELGALLQKEAPLSLHNYARLTNSDVVIKMLGHMRSSLESGQSAFAEIYNSSFYEALQKRPEDAAVFNGAMKEISAQDNPEILEAYDPGGADSVIDIGGGQGYLLATILDKYPQLQGTLFELPVVSESAADILAPHIDSKRCQIVKGDFLEAVSGDGDHYILKRVLSHCSDDDAIKLLSNIRKIFKADNRLLIIDPDTESLYGASYNLLMLAVVGGKGVRDEDELQSLFSLTGFKLERKITLKTELCIVEAVAA